MIKKLQVRSSNRSDRLVRMDPSLNDKEEGDDDQMNYEQLDPDVVNNNDGDDLDDEYMEQTEPEKNKMRFILDLEFVQALANPNYLKFLAQHEKGKYFEDERFIYYLKYLLFWKKPEYIK